jgi:hypothetical protein
MAIGGERKQMKRRRQARRAQPARFAAARYHQRVEALLFVKRRAHAQAVDERDEAVAAMQEDVLAVVDLAAADLERRRASAQETGALEDVHLESAALKLDRRREPRKARADDGYPGSHAFSITPTFSARESAARRASGNSGSRSILPRMRS